jgi:hypothetical protein
VNPRGVQYWSDYLQSSLHPKSYCEMPLWTNQKNFDTFFAGQSLELVPSDVREGSCAGMSSFISTKKITFWFVLLIVQFYNAISFLPDLLLSRPDTTLCLDRPHGQSSVLRRGVRQPPVCESVCGHSRWIRRLVKTSY